MMIVGSGLFLFILVTIQLILNNVYATELKPESDDNLLSESDIMRLLRSNKGIESHIPQRFRRYAREGWGVMKRRKRRQAPKGGYTDKLYLEMLNTVYRRVIRMSESDINSSGIAV